MWLEGRVDRQWRDPGGGWKVAVYYYVGLLQHYRVYAASSCRRIQPE